MKNWFENEEFWKDLWPFMFPETRLTAADDEINEVLQLTKIKQGAVLDLCCGPGRHSLVLAKQGFKVTSVDRSTYLLNHARRAAKKERHKIEWVREDMRHFLRPGAFDLVINMFTSFGYFDDPSDDMLVLSNIYENLKPGGALLIDVMGKEVLASNFQPTKSHILPNGSMLVERLQVSEAWSRLHSQWMLIKGDRVKSFELRLNIYSGQELKDKFQRTGFKRVKLFGNLKGKEYGPGASRLTVVGWK